MVKAEQQPFTLNFKPWMVLDGTSAAQQTLLAKQPADVARDRISSRPTHSYFKL